MSQHIEKSTEITDSPTHYNQVATRMQLATLGKAGEFARRALYVLAFVLAATVIWAALAESDVCAESVGELVPKIRLQVVRTAVDGTMDKYLVTDGQSVRKGQTLVLLNRTRAEADLEKQKQHLAVLQIERKVHQQAKDRLEEIIANPEKLASSVASGLPEANQLAGEVYASKKALDQAVYDATATATSGLHNTPIVSDLLSEKQRMVAGRSARERAIAERTSEHSAMIQKLHSRVSLIETDSSKTKAILAEQEAALVDAKSELSIYEKGKVLGVASGVKFLDVQNYLHQRQFAVIQTKTRLAEQEQQLESAKLDLESARANYHADRADMEAALKADDARIIGVPLQINDTARNVNTKRAEYKVALYHAKARLTKELSELDNLDRKIGEETALIESLEYILSERVITSPINGVVSQCSHLAPGELVERGRELMTIVPEDKSLLVRAHVRSTDIGFVKPEQNVRLRFEAYPCEEFGIVHGTVSRVENYPEPTEEEKKKESTYRVNIIPAQDWIGNGSRRAELKIGMAAHGDIVVRKRSMLMLFFAPFFKLNS